MTGTEQPGSALTPEQWRLVQQLGQSLGPAQAQWISGYFAGLEAGLARAGAQPMAAAGRPAARKLTILYGSETGNSAGVARTLGEEARKRELVATVADMADYKVRQLGQEEDVLIVVSTYGEGDPPQPATGFFEFVEGRKAPKLDSARFAVLALGDSTYEFYCEAGKRLDRRFEELGATRLAPRVDCDVDYDDPAAKWSDEILTLLAEEQAKSAASAPVPAMAAAGGATFAPQAVHDKRNPFAATVLDNLPIVGRGSTKETRHIELSLEGSGIVYEPGDALGLLATNEPELVSMLLDTLQIAGDAPVGIKGEQTGIADALTRHFEITAATPRFLDHWAQLTQSEELQQLQQEDRAGERAAFLSTHHIIDIVRRFPLSGLSPQDLVGGLRPLQPRLYSLASSLAYAPEEAHLTVSPVRYTLHDMPRAGVASAMLADRSPEDTLLPVYIQSNPHFRLPADGAPLVMIGAGTGVAPYRAFMQQREAGGGGGRSWLFFGERNFRTDFLYQTEWQAWLKDGTLSRMDVAFSRDRGQKYYVQHRMQEQSADLFAWIEEGAHIYVCGDATHLAPDVHETLLNIVAKEARIGREAAEDYMRALQADRRYQRDVY